jgi:hypothetical protein
LDDSAPLPPQNVPATDARLTPDQQHQLVQQLEAMSGSSGSDDESLRHMTTPSPTPQKVRDENVLASYFNAGNPAKTADAVTSTAQPSTASESSPAPTSQSAEVAETLKQSPSDANQSPKTTPSADPTPAVVPPPERTTPEVKNPATTSEPLPDSSATTAQASVPETSTDEKSTESTTASSTNWQLDLHQAVEKIERQLLDQSLSKDERIRVEATLRMLYVAENRHEDAAKPISALDSEQQEFWKLSFAGWFELLDTEGSPVAGRRAKLALRHFRDAVFHLASSSSLEVRNLAICQRVDSFGCYTEFEPYEFSPEQEVILYVEVGNFSVEQKEGGYETELQGSYQILDNSGRSVADTDLMLDKQICRNMRTDYFLPYRVFLPKNLSPGKYRIQVTVEDKKGHKFGQTPAVEFSVK